ncbi:DUF4303 domain-containing protein [Paenibacillus mesotrionivorans]|uniref:DUF4303 domain-containing protein n=1 Tax=Paenibacillus mesotrionivorans TaxID=3160968 RepID=A0ACC7NYK3_9BACL
MAHLQNTYTKKELKNYYEGIYDAVYENNKTDVDKLLEKCPDLFQLPYYSKPRSERDKNVIGKMVDIYSVSPEMIVYLIEKGADFNQLDDTLGIPAFCNAVMNPGSENLPVKMAKHMNDFRTDAFLNNPYFYAILTLNLDLVRVLVEKDLDLSVTYEHPFFEKAKNVLSYALLFRDFFQGSQWEQEAASIYSLIEQASRKQEVAVPAGTAPTENRQQPLTKGDLWFFKNALIQGVRRKNEAMVGFFSNTGGAALREPIFENGTALHFICEKGTVGMIKGMIQGGADPLQSVKTSYNGIKLPAVGVAIAKSNVEVALYLLKEYPHTAAQDKKGDLLQMAIRFSKDKVSYDLVKTLVEAGSSINVYYEYKGWRTSLNPISLAVSDGKSDVAEYLEKMAIEKGIVLQDYPLREPDKAEIEKYESYVELYTRLKSENKLATKQGKRQKPKAKYAAFALNLRAAVRVALEYAATHFSNETAYQFTLAFDHDGESSVLWTVLSTEEEYAKANIDESLRYIIDESGKWNLAEDAFALLPSLLKKLPFDQDDYLDQIKETALQCLEDIREEGLLEVNHLGHTLVQFHMREVDGLDQVLQMAERLNPDVEELARYKQSMELFW